MKVNRKSIIIMDEVDGMSSGDRGGVGALNALIKKTKVPIIAICNDKSTPKMKPLSATCFQMNFKRCVQSCVPSACHALICALICFSATTGRPSTRSARG
jgi:DNA polymerase III delta prime subunit